MRKSKRYKNLCKNVDLKNIYSSEQACDLLIKLANNYPIKFTQSIDVSFNLNLKKKHSISGSLLMPNSSFLPNVRILVFAKGEKIEEAKKAGAKYIGDDEIINKIKNGWMDFDLVISTPDMMKEVGKLGVFLGKKSLMPNVKIGTITFDIKGAISEFKSGKVFFKSDKMGSVHFKIGNVSMNAVDVANNLKAFYQKIIKSKPAGMKGIYIKNMYLSSTMGCGLKINHNSI